MFMVLEIMDGWRVVLVLEMDGWICGQVGLGVFLERVDYMTSLCVDSLPSLMKSIE